MTNIRRDQSAADSNKTSPASSDEGAGLCDAVVPPEIRSRLRLLLKAHDYARDVMRDVWDFAVEIRVLRAAGLTLSHFRWLTCKGYVEHAREITMPGRNSREFQRGGDLSFSARTCFVLTPAGLAVARAVRDQNGAHQGPQWCNGTTKRCARPAPPTPRWDTERQEFYVGSRLVKAFKLPSPNQEAVLSAFQEEGWPPRIDDPLPPHLEIDPKRRLHDTIKSLNRSQKRRLIRFTGDGSGEGVGWTLIGTAGNGDATDCQGEGCS